MDALFSLLVLVGGIGTYYFIKKKPDKKNRNICISILVVGFLGVGIFSDTSKTDESEKSKNSKVTEKSDTLSSEEIAELNAVKDKKIAERDKKNKESENKEEDKQLEQEKKKQERIAKEAEDKAKKEAEETSDITILSEKPTDNQAITLQTLADMQFDQQYPYKGSKMHSILGVLQDWTSTDGETWFYKVEATIVNAFGAERSANVEVHITPNGPDSGYVEFLDY